MKIFAAITVLESRWEWNKISIKYDAKILSEYIKNGGIYTWGPFY